MKANIEIEDHGSYLTIRLQGTISTTEDLIDTTRDITSQYEGLEHQKIFVDASALVLPISLHPYLGLVDAYSEILSPNLEVATVAFSVSPEYSHIADFYELTCANRGYNYCVFLSSKHALEWLQDQ